MAQMTLQEATRFIRVFGMLRARQVATEREVEMARDAVNGPEPLRTLLEGEAERTRVELGPRLARQTDEAQHVLGDARMIAGQITGDARGIYDRALAATETWAQAAGWWKSLADAGVGMLDPEMATLLERNFATQDAIDGRLRGIMGLVDDERINEARAQVGLYETDGAASLQTAQRAYAGMQGTLRTLARRRRIADMLEATSAQAGAATADALADRLEGML